jgi:hypothetical protein
VSASPFRKYGAVTATFRRDGISNAPSTPKPFVTAALSKVNGSGGSVSPKTCFDRDNGPNASLPPMPRSSEVGRTPMLLNPLSA